MSEKTFTRPTDQDEIRQRYNAETEHEWNRLELDAYHRLEFTSTMHMLHRHLPTTGLVLDAGGGPGRYARELCRMGYQVVLLDYAPGLLEKAREVFAEEAVSVQANLRQCIEGDIRDLSLLPSGSFDATLCLGGPLSHIHNATERQQAMAELARVTKPGGIIVLCVIGYLAALRTLLWKYQGKHFLDEAYMRGLVEEGNGGSWHFFRAEEIRHLAQGCGITTVEMAGCESLSTGLPESTNRLVEDPSRWSHWQEVLLRYSTEPSVVDMAGHILYIGRKGAYPQGG